jgi:CheY-like chemotaxis protein
MKKLLIVDDCKEFCEALGELLSEAGYEISCAGDAAEALKLCENESFALVFCDIALPSGKGGILDEHGGSAMTGMQTIKELAVRYPALPIVAVSGYMTGMPLQGLTSFGAARCLSKPFSREDLLATVEDVLGQGA